jgi:hypothetical protein
MADILGGMLSMLGGGALSSGGDVLMDLLGLNPTLGGGKSDQIANTTAGMFDKTLDVALGKTTAFNDASTVNSAGNVGGVASRSAFDQNFKNRLPDASVMSYANQLANMGEQNIGGAQSSMDALNRRSDTTTGNLINAVTGTVNASGGPETRPRNVALLACIKY